MSRQARKITPAASPPRPAGKSRSCWAVFLLLLVLGLLADLWSKAAVFNWLAGSDPIQASRVIIPGVLKFTLSTNPGIVFGFDKLPPAAIVLATTVAVGVILYFFSTSPARSHVTHCALAVILAGALGNLYDRLFSRVHLPGEAVIHREVRDFIDLTEIHYRWVFNVADVLLVIGVALLLLTSLAQWRGEKAAEKANRQA